jgi:transposase
VLWLGGHWPEERCNHAELPYKARARIEQGVGRLKRFKRLALRCEKTERNFRSIVSFAAGLC